MVIQKEDFYNISIRGRIAYCILCLKKYADTVYPNDDFVSVYTMACRIIDGSDYVDEAAYRYMEIIPEYLFEFRDYQSSDFEYLSEQEYGWFVSVLNLNDKYLNSLMNQIYETAMLYAYTTVPIPAKRTAEMILEVIEVLKQCGITPPDISAVSEYTYDESDIFGKSINLTKKLR